MIIAFVLMVAFLARLIIVIAEEPDIGMQTIIDRIFPLPGPVPYYRPIRSEIKKPENDAIQNTLLEYRYLHVADMNIMREINKLIYEKDAPYSTIQNTLDKASNLTLKKAKRAQKHFVTEGYKVLSKELERKILEFSKSAESPSFAYALSNYAQTLREFRTSIKKNTFRRYTQAKQFFEENL